MKSPIPCYVIALEDELDRRRHMEGQVEAAGMELRFWNAIHGARMNRDEIDRNRWLSVRFFVGRHPLWVRLNQLGCALSHHRLAQFLLAQGIFDDGPVLVLEDDVLLEADLLERMDSLQRRCPRDTDILYMGHSGPGIGEALEDGLVRARAPRGTFAQLLWKNGARKLVADLFPLHDPIDETLAQWAKAGQWNAVVADPPLVRHGDLGSTIYTRKP